MKIKDVIEKFPEESRKEVEKTIDACMTSIDCSDVNWREFTIYDSSLEIVVGILRSLAIEFLLPIAEETKKESEREVVIFCSTTAKEDEIWFVRVKSTQLHATINLSGQTWKYISKEKEK